MQMCALIHVHVHPETRVVNHSNNTHAHPRSYMRVGGHAYMPAGSLVVLSAPRCSPLQGLRGVQILALLSSERRGCFQVAGETTDRARVRSDAVLQRLKLRAGDQGRGVKAGRKLSAGDWQASEARG